MKNESFEQLAQRLKERNSSCGLDPREENLLQYGSCSFKKIRAHAVRSNIYSLMKEGKPLPDWMNELFVNEAGRELDGGVAWPTYNKRETCPRVIAMVQVIFEYFGMVNGRPNRSLRNDIAAHLGRSPQTVSNYLRRTGYEIIVFAYFYREAYSEQYMKGKTKADLVKMLNTLTDLAKKPVVKLLEKQDPEVISAFYGMHPSAEQWRREARSSNLQTVQFRGQMEGRERYRGILEDLKSDQLELMSQVESLNRRISQAEDLLKKSLSE